MLRIFGDFESFYDRVFSLRKMSPVEYILDPRWETLACAVAIDREAPFLLPQDDVARFLTDIRQPYAFISHNILFDGVVTRLPLRHTPPALMCTLSLARATIYHQIPNGRLSLKNVAQASWTRRQGRLYSTDGWCTLGGLGCRPRQDDAVQRLRHQ